MIHGFKDKCVTTAEEWLMDYSLRTGNSIDINTDLLDMPIKFDGKEVDAFILDIIDNKLVIQLVLPTIIPFDGKSNRYETSYVRNLINSSEFLNRFNKEFINHIQITEVHTEDYITNDKLWLLSHEEIYQCSDDLLLRPNHECHAFEMFKTIDLKAYSRMLLRSIEEKINAYGWRLRSACSYSSYNPSKYVGTVNEYGLIGYNYAHHIADGVVLPACTIC